MATIYDIAISYEIHPSVAHVQAVLANLKSRTGQDLETWVTRVRAEGPAEEKARRRATWRRHLATSPSSTPERRPGSLRYTGSSSAPYESRPRSGRPRLAEAGL